MKARFASWIIAGPATGQRLARLIVERRNDEALDLLHQIGGPSPLLARALAPWDCRACGRRHPAGQMRCETTPSVTAPEAA